MLQILVEALGFLPLVLAFYLPALLGVAIWSEQGPGYKAKAAVMLALGFGAIVFVQVVFRNVSAPQVAATVGVSLVQISAALALAALTVYKLAD
jgi:hypothetical protein